MRAGDRLAFGRARAGARAYLCVEGGIAERPRGLERPEAREQVAPRMAPGIGEHTRALLAEFGCSEAQIEALAEG